MRIGRTLPPAATPIHLKNIFTGLRGIINGNKEINRFESELKDYFKVDHCFVLSSGKAALTIILKALHEQHPERNEVIIPAFTCYSVPSAILKSGLKIRLCDINPDTLDFDFDQLKKQISGNKNILAVVPTHLLGLPMDVERVRQITGDDAVSIVEDAAQAMGNTRKGKKLGTIGDAGFFSLGRGKVFSTVEGGIILTRNHQLAEAISGQIKKLPAYRFTETVKLFVFSLILTVFMRPAFFWFPKSLPFLKLGETFFEPDFPIKKLSPFQAGLSKDWIKRLSQLMADRKQKIQDWEKDLRTCASEKKQNIKRAGLAQLRFPIKITDADALDRILAASEKNGLGMMRTYPDSVNHITEITDSFKDQEYPCASTVAGQILTLPVHHFMNAADRKKIKKILDKELS